MIFDQMGVREGDVAVLNLNEFIKLMDSNGGDNLSGSASPGKLRNSFTSEVSSGDVLSTIRNRLQSGANDRSLTSTGSKKISIVAVENALTDACSGNTRDTRNMVSMKQFSSAMEQVGIRLRASDIENLFKLLSGDKRTPDSINYREFIDALVATPRGGDSDLDASSRVRSRSPARRSTSRSRSPRSPAKLSRSSSKNDRK